MSVKVRAPGRVNLIGEHTDYNYGFVLPAAIDIFLEVTAKRKPGRLVTVYAEQLNASESFSLDGLNPPGEKPIWVDYIRAVCRALIDEGYLLDGADLKISSAIPIGAGLSSSAALEIAVAAAMSAINGHSISLEKMALLCQKAENDFVGVRCGIMDQFAVALGRKNHALLLDCRSLEYSYVPLNTGNYRLLIIDSRVERNLGASNYNRRREECEEALEELSKLLNKKFDALRELSPEQIEEVKSSMTAELYRRSLFVAEENKRVIDSVRALKGGDLSEFGSLMYLSHQGLKDLYEVSCPELDLIVETASEISGVLGARLTGAGFGGCVLCLADKSVLGLLEEKVEESFADLKWNKPHFYRVSAADGVAVSSN